MHKRENVADNQIVLVGVPCVIDNIGVVWYYLEDEERITVLEKDGKTFAEGGYMCQSLEDGIWYLEQDDYIFDPPEVKDE